MVEDVKSCSLSKLNIVNIPSQNLIQSWIQKHADLLAKERQIEQEEARLLLSNCPPKQLERNGLALLGLGILSISVGLGGKTLIELERPSAFHSSITFPPHQIRPGDIVQLEDHSVDPSAQGGGGKSSKGKNAKNAKGSSTDTNHGNDEESIGGVVFRISDTKLIVAASNKRGNNQKDGLDLSDLPSRIRVVKVANDATFDRMEWTLTKLAKALNVSVKTAKRNFDADSSGDEKDEGEDEQISSSGSSSSSTLIPTLMGQSIPKWDEWPKEEELRLFNENLNQSQIDAIKFALNAQNFALIHGPPGTGKTTAIAEMVLQLALIHQKRILVCGASNLAADNLLERILTKGGDLLRKSHIGITRIGHPARVLQSLMTATLDYQIQHSSEGALVKDVRKELEEALSSLRPKDNSTIAGNKSTSSRGQASSKFQRVKGSERKERKEEIKSLRKEFRKRERGLVKAVLKKASIVVATCHGAGAKQLDGMEFDVVVIDEACQATEATCWTPIMKAKQDGKLILAGDHLQLPPTVKGYRHSQFKKEKTEKKEKDEKSQVSEGEEEEEEQRYLPNKTVKRTNLRPPRSLETTLFSRLLGMYGQGCKALLDIQYRMNKEIMAFPNEALYEGKIQADESCRDIRLADLSGYKPILHDETGDEEEETDIAPIVFYDTAGCEMYESQQNNIEEGGKQASFQFDSKANAHEVEFVAKHVETLLERGLEPEKISILSPYNLQVSALADRLRGGGEDEKRKPSSISTTNNNKLSIAMEKVVIGSIDSMQGMENEVIIISLVRSNEQKSVGFLAEKRRLNVAMTRAKRQLCIIGDSETIGESGDQYLEKWMKFLDENAFIEPVMV